MIDSGIGPALPEAAPARAAALVTMARRQGDLPECEALFHAGSLTEDAMKVITAKAPPERDELFHERHPDADPTVRGELTWADAFVHLAEVALDALDPATRRGEPLWSRPDRR